MDDQDGLAILRGHMVSDAAAKNWPYVSYTADLAFVESASRKTHATSLYRRTVGPGQANWERFLSQAEFLELIRAQGALERALLPTQRTGSSGSDSHTNAATDTGAAHLPPLQPEIPTAIALRPSPTAKDRDLVLLEAMVEVLAVLETTAECLTTLQLLVETQTTAEKQLLEALCAKDRQIEQLHSLLLQAQRPSITVGPGATAQLRRVLRQGWWGRWLRG